MLRNAKVYKFGSCQSSEITVLSFGANVIDAADRLSMNRRPIQQILHSFNEKQESQMIDQGQDVPL